MYIVEFKRILWCIRPMNADLFFKNALSRNERYLASTLLFFMATFGIFDFLGDVQDHAPTLHLTIELTLSLLAFAGSVALVIRFFKLHDKLKIAHVHVENHKADALKWKEESAKYVEGLSQVIDNQFERWGMTPAEKDVALLLLKGFSLKEISDLRKVSERTISHQSVSIYNKSGTSGRAGLSAFFLEDLLAPLEKDITSDASSL